MLFNAPLSRIPSPSLYEPNGCRRLFGGQWGRRSRIPRLTHLRFFFLGRYPISQCSGLTSLFSLVCYAFRLDANSAILCNYEVYQLLQDVKKASSSKKKKAEQKNLATITYQVSLSVFLTPLVSVRLPWVRSDQKLPVSVLYLHGRDPAEDRTVCWVQGVMKWSRPCHGNICSLSLFWTSQTGQYNHSVVLRVIIITWDSKKNLFFIALFGVIHFYWKREAQSREEGRFSEGGPRSPSPAFVGDAVGSVWWKHGSHYHLCTAPQQR